MSIPVRAFFGGFGHDLCTEDISYGGVFVLTEDAPPVHELIRVELPDVWSEAGDPLRVCAMVAHTAAPGTPGRRPGMGLQFYGIGRADRVAWVSFVDLQAAQAPDRPPSANSPLILDAMAVPGSAPSRLRLVPDDVSEMSELYARLITGRAVIVASSVEAEPADVLGCELVHPSSRRSMGVPLTVLRKVVTDRRPAFLVTLDDPDGARGAGLWRFITSAESAPARDAAVIPQRQQSPRNFAV